MLHVTLFSFFFILSPQQFVKNIVNTVEFGMLKTKVVSPPKVRCHRLLRRQAYHVYSFLSLLVTTINKVLNGCGSARYLKIEHPWEFRTNISVKLSSLDSDVTAA
jgi:hypothetical protein